jgi:hypothetical protein
VPGVNQYGFDENVVMTEGFDSMRYWTQQRKETYAKGADHLFRNDQPLPKQSPTPILTDKQTDEAIRVIKEQSKLKIPFFINLWYDAPHSPWEAMEPYYSKYQNHFSSELQRRYASMVTNMDMNIGRILDILQTEGLSQDTLVFFTSDNGPEMDVGSPGLFKGRKRLLTEGGIRIPAMAYWPGHIKPGSTSDAFLLTTDIFPTLISAAGGFMPGDLRIDGLSFLPVLLQPNNLKRRGDERMVLWYTHSIGYPKFTAARAHGFKLLWADYEGRKGKNLPPSWRIFDLHNDAYENSNLHPSFQQHCSIHNQLELQSKSNKEQKTLPWQYIATKHKVDAHSLALMRFLQLAIYLFRFDGERSWLSYHSNKPFETASTCGKRTPVTAETLPMFSHIQQPQFCGAALMQEGAFGCVCALEDCEGLWLQPYMSTNQSEYEWTDNRAFMGVSYYAPVKGTLNSHVQNILKWTRFNDMCPNAQLMGLFDVLTRSSLQAVTRQQRSCVDTTHAHFSYSRSHHSSHNENAYNVQMQNEMSFAQGDFVGQEWQRSCHQRVHYDTKLAHWFVRTSGCAQDLPLLQVNIVGMPRGVNICPDSLERLMSPTPAENLMDDNLLLGLLNLVLLNVVGAKGEEDIVMRSRPDHFLAVVDPLFFHLADLHHIVLSNVSITTAESKAIVQQFWGLLQDWEYRMSGSCSSDCLQFTVWPWLSPFHVGYWALTIAMHPQPQSPSDQHSLQIVHILPSPSTNAIEYLSAHNSATNVVDLFVTEFFRKSRQLSDEQQIAFSAHTIQSTHSGLIPSLETMKVIVLLKLVQRSLLSSVKQIDSIESIRKMEKNLPLNTIFSERKKLIDFIIFQSREAFQQRKKTIKFMSAPKFDLKSNQ